MPPRNPGRAGAAPAAPAAKKPAAKAGAPAKTLYLFLGPEAGEKQDALNELRARLRAGGDLEETSFYAGESSAGGMAGIIQNGSLFSENRLFLIKNAEDIDGRRKAELDTLVSCFESLREGTTVVLLSDQTRIEGRLERAADPKNRRIFWELFEERKAGWVRAFFQREGFRIDQDAVDTVLELVENNTDALRRECGRLCLFMDKSKPVGAEDVENWLAHSREESAFTLFSRIAQGDPARSIETLRSLLAAKTAPQAILAGLVSSYRRFRDYLALTRNGIDDESLRRGGFSSPRARKDFSALARRQGNALDSLSLIAEFDLLLRSSGTGLEECLLDFLVLKLATESGKPRELWFRY